jgi:hypothetical protein
MSLSIQLPDNLEQQFSVYCQEYHHSINETVRLALLSPCQLDKDGFGADQTHEGNIAQHSKKLLKARFRNNADS